MTALTVQQFRVDFQEFSSTTVFPNDMVNFYINLSANMLNANGSFGAQLNYAQELFTAHCITIESRAMSEAKGGGIPGTMVAGIPSSKSVDKVSVSYDTSAILDPTAGHWNLSTYGIRLWQMMRLFGAGPLFVGVGVAPPLNGPAWTGPDCSPGPYSFGN